MKGQHRHSVWGPGFSAIQSSGAFISLNDDCNLNRPFSEILRLSTDSSQGLTERDSQASADREKSLCLGEEAGLERECHFWPDL